MGLHEADISCVPYSRRPEWADVEPLPPPPGDAGKVVSIQYSERHAEALGYFRAVLAKGEKSARALELTRHLISFNGADYTAWQWRWLCVQALGSDLAEERALTERAALESAKNYQLWNHRRKAAAALGPGAAAAELAFAARFLEADAKNYHAWAHRQAVVAAAGLWEEELRYCEVMVESDVRNNSAWAQRAWIKLTLLKRRQDQPPPTEGAPTPADAAHNGAATAAASAASEGARRRVAFEEVLQGELEYVAGQLAVAPRNESAWNYLLGLFRLPGATPHEMGRWKEVGIICREALSDCPSCAPALDALALYYFDMACLLRDAAAATAADGPAEGSTAAAGAPAGDADAAAATRGAGAGGALARARDAAAKALAVLEKAATADPMRRPYLAHRRAVAEALLRGLGPAP